MELDMVKIERAIKENDYGILGAKELHALARHLATEIPKHPIGSDPFNDCLEVFKKCIYQMRFRFQPIDLAPVAMRPEPSQKVVVHPNKLRKSGKLPLDLVAWVDADQPHRPSGEVSK